MERIEDPLEYAWGAVSHLTGVLNSDELRAAHQEAMPLVVAASTKVSQSAAVFAGLKAVEAKAQKAAAAAAEFAALPDVAGGGVQQCGTGAACPDSGYLLDPAQSRVVAQALRSMTLSGVGLEGEAKESFNANRVKLSELSTTYSNNVLDATKAYGLTLTDPKDVEGLPLSSKGLAAQAYNAHVAAEAAKEDGAKADTAATAAAATAESGPWRLCLDMPSYLPAMKHLKSSAVREQIYRAFVTRAGEDNAPLLDQILSLKQAQAQFLGFQTAAEVSMQAKMAAKVEAVDALTEQLLEKAKPAAEQELKDLTAFAKSKVRARVYVR